MASPSTVLTRGYGDWSSVNLLPTLGYGIGEVIIPDHTGFRVCGVAVVSKRVFGDAVVTKRVEGDAILNGCEGGVTG